MRSLESGTHSSSFAGTAPQMVAPGPASPHEASKNPLSTPQSPGLLNARTGQGVQRRPQGKLALPGGLTRKKPGGLEVGRLQGQSQMRQQVHRRVPEMAVEPGSATPMDFHNNLVRMKVGGAGWRMQGKGRRRGAQGRSQGRERGASVAERASGEDEGEKRARSGTFSSVAQF